MRATAIALIVSLGTWGLGLGAWGTTLHAQEAQQWRKVADAIPLGSKVKIQTFEGKRVSGTLMRVDDTGVAVKKNTRIPEAAVTVTYDAIANIERDHGGGMNLGKAIGFGLAAGASAIATIFVIALQWD
jgi:3D (Asp-Asp-Asp) domain-containing protein